mmetsp:Transcript_22465/g.58447  ORF Transcript_22465/g.58447 Transcript_22465/m.58447 type:complete len:207 (-) Transcript_22465:1570-2190(-)
MQILQRENAGCGRSASTTAEGTAPRQATSLIDASSGKAPRQPRWSNKSPTSCAACQSGSFMPSNNSASRRAHFASAGSSTESFAKALARTRPRPDDVVSTRSPRPQGDSKNVARSASRRRDARAWISTRPALMRAARAFGPATASAKPLPKATTFLRTPQSSTPARSSTVSTRNAGLAKTRAASAAVVASSAPTVASANSPRAKDP